MTDRPMTAARREELEHEYIGEDNGSTHWDGCANAAHPVCALREALASDALRAEQVRRLIAEHYCPEAEQLGACPVCIIERETEGSDA